MASKQRVGKHRKNKARNRSERFQYSDAGKFQRSLEDVIRRQQLALIDMAEALGQAVDCAKAGKQPSALMLAGWTELVEEIE